MCTIILQIKTIFDIYFLFAFLSQLVNSVIDCVQINNFFWNSLKVNSDDRDKNSQKINEFYNYNPYEEAWKFGPMARNTGIRSTMDGIYIDNHTTFADVKLETNEKLPQIEHLKSWTKCAIDVRAIESYPCFLEIAFYHEDDRKRTNPFHVIRIDATTLQTGALASRTKYNAHGLFWQRNGKNCKVFFAFDTREKLNLYVKYLNLLIRLLGMTRLEQEVLQRNGQSPQPITNDNEAGLNASDSIQNERGVFGTLPNSPDIDEWNCMSDDYEENEYSIDDKLSKKMLWPKSLNNKHVPTNATAAEINSRGTTFTLDSTPHIDESTFVLSSQPSTSNGIRVNNNKLNVLNNNGGQQLGHIKNVNQNALMEGDINNNEERKSTMNNGVETVRIFNPLPLPMKREEIVAPPLPMKRNNTESKADYFQQKYQFDRKIMNCLKNRKSMSVPDAIHLDDSRILNLPFDITTKVELEMPLNDGHSSYENIYETIQFDSQTNARYSDDDRSVVQVQTMTTVHFRVIEPDDDNDDHVNSVHDNSYDSVNPSCCNHCPNASGAQSNSKLNNTYDSIHPDIFVNNKLNTSRQSAISNDKTYDSVFGDITVGNLNRSHGRRMNSTPVNGDNMNTSNLNGDMHANEHELSHTSMRRISNLEAEKLQVRCRSLNPTIQPPDYAEVRRSWEHLQKCSEINAGKGKKRNFFTRKRKSKLKKSSIVHLHMMDSLTPDQMDTALSSKCLSSYETESIGSYNSASSASSSVTNINSISVPMKMNSINSDDDNIFPDVRWEQNNSGRPLLKPKRQSKNLWNLIENLMGRQKKKSSVDIQPAVNKAFECDNEFKSKLDNTYESIHFIGDNDNAAKNDECEVNNRAQPILSLHPSLLGIRLECMDDNVVDANKLAQDLMSKMDDVTSTAPNVSFAGRPSIATMCSWSSFWTDDDLTDTAAMDTSQLITDEIRRLSKGSIIDERILDRNTLALGECTKEASCESLNNLELLATKNVECLGIFVPISTNVQNSSSSSKSSSYVSAKDDSYCGSNVDDNNNNHVNMDALIDKMLRNASTDDDDYHGYARDKWYASDDALSAKCITSHHMYKNTKHILPQPKLKFFQKNVMRTCVSLKNKLLAVMH